MSATYQYEKVSAPGRTFLNRVFEWMGIGLGITALVSYSVYASPSLLAMLITQNGVTGLGYIVMFAPIIFVLIMSLGYNRLSSAALTVLFLAYAAIMGASLSFIFLIYTAESIYKTFLIAALMFGAMGLIGFTTKADLTKLGSITLMGLLGIIIASLVNMFFKSNSAAYAISFLSVIIFCGLTAWDLQKLKRISSDSTVDQSKIGIYGALTLYLDFINLFLSLLRLFGRRRD